MKYMINGVEASIIETEPDMFTEATFVVRYGGRFLDAWRTHAGAEYSLQQFACSQLRREYEEHMAKAENVTKVMAKLRRLSIKEFAV